MGCRINFTEEQIQEMIKMYVTELKSIKNIANKFDVDSEVILDRLKINNIKIAKGSAYSIKYWLQRGLTEEEARCRIKNNRPTNLEYWRNKGYSEEEAKLQTDGQTLKSLKGCIARFGKEEGTRIWNNRAELRSINGKKGSANLEYWRNKGYSEEEAIIKRAERQNTFTLEKCIKKYGEEEGTKKYNERQIKWQESLYRNGKLKSGCSEVSQKLFYKLLENYELNETNNILFSSKGGEMVLKDNKCFFKYDFTDLKNKKIIEYNGDLFHGNPKIYKETDYPNPLRKNVTAKEIWEKDKRKINLANKEGFEVLIIWDSDYIKNPEKEIEKCIEFLNKK